MRKQVHWQWNASLLILRACDGLRECSDVCHDRKLTASEKSLQSGKIWVQAVGNISGFGDDRKQGILRQREVRANVRVVLVTGRVVRNDQVIAVISAKEEYANKGLVTAGLACCQGVNQVEPSQSRGHSEGCSAAASSAQDVSARYSASPTHVHAPAARPLIKTSVALDTAKKSRSDRWQFAPALVPGSNRLEPFASL